MSLALRKVFSNAALPTHSLFPQKDTLGFRLVSTKSGGHLVEFGFAGRYEQLQKPEIGSH